MGKTNKPHRFLIHPSLIESPEVQELIAKGHEIDAGPMEAGADPWAYDAILGPTCWRMTLQHMKYLPLTVEEIRKRPKEKS